MPFAIGLAIFGLLFLGWAMLVGAGHTAAWAYDFNAYYDAALRLLHTGSAYQAETLSGPFRPGPGGLYLYSPLPALLLVPLTALTPDAAMFAWVALRVALLALACAVMPVPRHIRLVLLGVAGLSAPVLHDLDLGNVSLLVTLLSAVVWRWVDRPIGAVALAVSMTVRPTMALVAGWWLVRRRWLVLGWAIAAGVLLVLASLPFVGVTGWVDYLTVMRNLADVTGVPHNVDLGSVVLQLGGPQWAALAALFGGYVAAGAAAVLSLRRDRELSFVVVLMATLLLSPLLWDHYLTQLLVPAAFLAARGRTAGLALPLLGWLPAPLLPVVALLGMLVPFLAPGPGGEAATGRSVPVSPAPA
jgi:hypothetical protein